MIFIQRKQGVVDVCYVVEVLKVMMPSTNILYISGEIID